jgi:hypothetical protein
MGLLELIIGILLFVFLVNLVFSFVPIPRGIAGTIVALLIIVLIWRMVF